MSTAEMANHRIDTRGRGVGGQRSPNMRRALSRPALSTENDCSLCNRLHSQRGILGSANAVCEGLTLFVGEKKIMVRRDTRPAPVTSACFTPWKTLGKLKQLRFIWEPESSLASACSSMLWVSCDALVGTKEAAGVRLGLVREAFDLLNLLARVDLLLWKTTMQALWPEFVNCEYLELEEAPLEIPMLGLACCYGLDYEHEALEHFNSVKPSSSDYQLLRSRVEEMLDKGEIHGGSIPLRMELKCPGASRHSLMTSCTEKTLHNTNELLEDLVEVATTKPAVITAKPAMKKSTRLSRRSSAPSFNLIELQFGFTANVVIDGDGLQKLRKLADYGVEVDSLPRLRIPKEAVCCVEVTDALQSLLLLHGESKPHVRNVFIADQDAHHLIPMVLSAVQDSQTVERVEINFRDWKRRGQRGRSSILHEWQQVAYSLFSKHANHNVETLALIVPELRVDEVEAVRTILKADNPLAALDGVACVASADRVARMTASRFRLEDPDCPVAPLQPEYFTPSEPQDVRVIEAPDSGDIHKQWTVWLPGHGKGWVVQEDVQSTQVLGTPHPSDRLQRPSFPRVDVVNVSDDSADAVIDLLELIAQSTKRISCILQIAPPFVAEWCRRLLLACAKVEHLYLCGAIGGCLALFADATMAGCWRVQELHHVDSSSLDTSSVLSFLKALQDPSHHLTKHLEVLDIKFNADPTITTAIIDALLEMLSHNRRLRKVHVDFHTELQRESDEVKKQYSSATRNLDAVFVRVAPLEIRKKAAFLSAVDSTTNGDTTSDRDVLARFDSSLITIVFAFAAQGRAREVRASFTCDIPDVSYDEEESGIEELGSDDSEEESESEIEDDVANGDVSEQESWIASDGQDESDEDLTLSG